MLHEAFNEDHRVFLVLRLNVTRNCGDLLRCHFPWIVLSYWMVLLAHDWISLTMVYWISFLSLTRCVLILKLWMYEFLMPSSIQTLSPWTVLTCFCFCVFCFFKMVQNACVFLFLLFHGPSKPGLMLSHLVRSKRALEWMSLGWRFAAFHRLYCQFWDYNHQLFFKVCV